MLKNSRERQNKEGLSRKYNLNIKKIRVHRNFYTNSGAFLSFLLYDVVKKLYQCSVEKRWCRDYYISSVFCTIIDTTRQRYIWEVSYVNKND